ncbi:MAG: hypothetical protein HY316_01205 [Acidobacteria bacterium]|nr:hypothetical protein [Acidobacteriota bacterium]
MRSWKSAWSLLLLATVAAPVLGADLSGTWKYVVKNPRGVMQQTFVFTQKGAELTGYIFSPDGDKEEIQQGKVKGEEIEFSVIRRRPSGDNPARVTYKGKVKGDEIIGQYVGPGGNTIEWTAKRESR